MSRQRTVHRHQGRNRGTIVRRPRGAPLTRPAAQLAIRVNDLISESAEVSNRAGEPVNAGVLQPPVKVSPPPAHTCYACDGAVVGVRDRRPEGGAVESACARHSDTTLAELFYRRAG